MSECYPQMKQFTVFEVCTNPPSNRDCSVLIPLGMDMTGQQETKGFPGFGCRQNIWEKQQEQEKVSTAPQLEEHSQSARL